MKNIYNNFAAARSHAKLYLNQLRSAHKTNYGSLSTTHQLYQPCLEKEKEAAEKRRPLALLPRLDCNSPSVVSAVTSVKESTPPVWEPVHPSTLPPSSSTSVPRSSSLPAMPPVTTRRLVSCPVTSPLPLRTMRS